MKLAENTSHTVNQAYFERFMMQFFTYPSKICIIDQLSIRNNTISLLSAWSMFFIEPYDYIKTFVLNVTITLVVFKGSKGDKYMFSETIIPKRP